MYAVGPIFTTCKRRKGINRRLRTVLISIHTFKQYIFGSFLGHESLTSVAELWLPGGRVVHGHRNKTLLDFHSHK